MTATVQPHACGRCPARWSGHRITHCALCHATFTTPANFDRHRAGSRSGEIQGECSDPAVRGLILNIRNQWAMPGDDTK